MSDKRIVIDPTAGTGEAPIVADRELWMNAEGTELVEAGSEDAAVLVASHPGKVIDPAVAGKLGLTKDEGGKVVVASAEQAEAQGVDTSEDAVVSYGAAELEGLKVNQLKEIAKERGVPGGSKMNRDELIVAIAEGGDMQEGGVVAAEDGGEGA